MPESPECAAMNWAIRVRFCFGLSLSTPNFQIRAIISRNDAFGVSQSKQSGNIATHFIGRRGSKRDDGRSLRQAFDEIGNAGIGRTEILAPLRHAMGLRQRR